MSARVKRRDLRGEGSWVGAMDGWDGAAVHVWGGSLVSTL
jgi:flagellar biosynthesis component FlhA